MLPKIVYRSFVGLSLACLFTFVALTILTVQDAEVPVFQVWIYMLGSMILGIYFGVSSLIFDIENWSPLKQLVVHFALSVLLWFLITFFMMRWIPFTPLSIVITFCIFVGVYMLIGLGFSVYYKKIVTELNDSMK